jgi:hypothetical protein
MKSKKSKEQAKKKGFFANFSFKDALSVTWRISKNVLVTVFVVSIIFSMIAIPLLIVFN